MAKMARFCSTAHRTRFRAGQKLDGGTLIPVQAMADAGFCPWCGAYVPNRNEQSIGLVGKLATFTPNRADFPEAIHHVQVVRIGVNGAGQVVGDLRLNDGALLPSEVLGDRLTDRGGSHARYDAMIG